MGSSIAGGSKATATVIDEKIKDGFRPMNLNNSDAEKFIRGNLDRFQFFMSDRVSITQFLSLFNVIGVGNAKKLDHLIKYIKE